MEHEDKSELIEAITDAVNNCLKDRGVSVTWLKERFAIRLDATSKVTDIQLGATIYGYLMSEDYYAGQETEFDNECAKTVRYKDGSGTRWILFAGISPVEQCDHADDRICDALGHAN